MKEDYTPEKHHGWIIWLSIFAVLIIGVGIFFYYTFLRQTHSELVEAVPTDVEYLFEVNDNETFYQTVTPLLPYFNEAFAMEALPAYETVYHKLPGRNPYNLTISGHPTENGTHILFNTHIEKAEFKKLLRALSIDPANYKKFEQYKIYTYGTNFKSLKFAYFNHILSISDDVELVKKALIQHTHPKSLLNDDIFKDLYTLTNKNVKQNWLILNCPTYGKSISELFTKEVVSNVKENNLFTSWAAFQLRISKNEVFLSGYTPASSEAKTFKQKVNQQLSEGFLPFNTEWFHKTGHRARSQYATCKFSLAADSSRHYEYFVIMQDSLLKTFIPYGDIDKAEALRNNYPNGIYPVTDSTFQGRLVAESKNYAFFEERNGNYIFAPTEDALNLYNKAMSSNGNILDNRYYKFSKNNVASTSIEEFTYYNSESNGHTQCVFSKIGKATKLGQQLTIFTASCTDISNDDYAAVNLYMNFNK